VEINWDTEGACLGDGDLGDAHRLIFELEDSVGQDGSLRTDHCGLCSWGREQGTTRIDDDADTSSCGKRHGDATACWRKRVGLSDAQRSKRLYTLGTL
jgi:hypothetical protein